MKSLNPARKTVPYQSMQRSSTSHALQSHQTMGTTSRLRNSASRTKIIYPTKKNVTLDDRRKHIIRHSKGLYKSTLLTILSMAIGDRTILKSLQILTDVVRCFKPAHSSDAHFSEIRIKEIEEMFRSYSIELDLQ